MSLPYRHQDLLNYERMLAEESAPSTQDNPCLQLLHSMLADQGWSADNTVRERLEQTLAALCDGEETPGDNPPPRDQAAWTVLTEEANWYLDYRRLARLEARLRGCADNGFRFTRNDWQALRAIEAALEAHNRQVRDSSYAPEPAPLFRVH